MTLALRTQLMETLDSLAWAPLTTQSLTTLAKRGGVYQLALLEEGALSPVYVGKALGDLPGRLGQHRRKLSGRLPGLIERALFRCAYVDEDLDSVAPEKMLMAELGSKHLAAWNTMGFGNKDPGKNRDKSLVKKAHFDRRYPINLDFEVTLKAANVDTRGQLMTSLKTSLPYTFRFGKLPAAVREVSLHIGDGTATKPAKVWLGQVTEFLPPDWRVIALPGYVIAYPGVSADDFPSRLGSWSATGVQAQYVPHDPVYEDGKVESDEDIVDDADD